MNDQNQHLGDKDVTDNKQAKEAAQPRHITIPILSATDYCDGKGTDCPYLSDADVGSGMNCQIFGGLSKISILPDPNGGGFTYRHPECKRAESANFPIHIEG